MLQDQGQYQYNRTSVHVGSYMIQKSGPAFSRNPTHHFGRSSRRCGAGRRLGIRHTDNRVLPARGPSLSRGDGMKMRLTLCLRTDETTFDDARSRISTA